MSTLTVEVMDATTPPPAGPPVGPSLMTPLGVVEGEVLSYLDRHPMTTLRRLNQEMGHPAYMVMMAVGALIRTGLVRAIRRDLDVILKLRRPLPSLA